MARRTSIVLGSFSHVPELFFELPKLLIGKVFEIDKVIARLFDRSNEFVQLELHCFGVAVLCVLNQEHHQKGDDGGRGVDNQLPRVGKMKHGAGKEPDQNDKHRCAKCPRAAEQGRGSLREDAKRVTDSAKEIALLLVFF